MSYKLKLRPSTSKKIMTHFIVRLTSLWWSGTGPTISLRCACISWKLAEDTRLLGQRQRILFFTAQHVAWASCVCQLSWPPKSNLGSTEGPRWKLHMSLYILITVEEPVLREPTALYEAVRLLFVPRRDITSSFEVARCNHKPKEWPR